MGWAGCRPASECKCFIQDADAGRWQQWVLMHKLRVQQRSALPQDFSSQGSATDAHPCCCGASPKLQTAQTRRLPRLLPPRPAPCLPGSAAAAACASAQPLPPPRCPAHLQALLSRALLPAGWPPPLAGTGCGPAEVRAAPQRPRLRWCAMVEWLSLCAGWAALHMQWKGRACSSLDVQPGTR